MMKVLEEIAENIDKVEAWSAMPADPTLTAHGAVSYEGKTDDWRFVVVAYVLPDDVVDHRYDGAAVSVKAGLVVRLTPELAERAFKRASAA